MDVNDNACFLNQRGAFKSIASELAPTGVWVFCKKRIQVCTHRIVRPILPS
jgi:hypothetical protein